MDVDFQLHIQSHCFRMQKTVYRSIFGNVVGLNLMSGDYRPEALHGGEPYCILYLFVFDPTPEKKLVIVAEAALQQCDRRSDGSARRAWSVIAWQFSEPNPVSQRSVPSLDISHRRVS